MRKEGDRKSFPPSSASDFAGRGCAHSPARSRGQTCLNVGLVLADRTLSGT